MLGKQLYSWGNTKAQAKRFLLALKAINTEGWGKAKHLVKIAQGFLSPPTLSGRAHTHHRVAVASNRAPSSAQGICPLTVIFHAVFVLQLLFLSREISSKLCNRQKKKKKNHLLGQSEKESAGNWAAHLIQRPNAHEALS